MWIVISVQVPTAVRSLRALGEPFLQTFRLRLVSIRFPPFTCVGGDLLRFRPFRFAEVRLPAEMSEGLAGGIFQSHECAVANPSPFRDRSTTGVRSPLAVERPA